MSSKPYTYGDVIKDLSTFLVDSGITKIVFHQFDFLIMYFPVYMVINNLKKNGLTIEFNIKENDESIIKGMVTQESFNTEEATLHLGLCEPKVFPENHPDKEKLGNYLVFEDLNNESEKNNRTKLHHNMCVKKDGEESYFIHLPFINFPPIYGVSLINRDIINKIKREKRREGVKKGVEKELSIMDFWRHFSAKLSLLDERKDFNKLVASSYPKGSTTDWFIREKIKFPLRGITWVETLEKEFDDLFYGLVDVAFTVQPWVAISKSEFHDPPLDVDIVYKNVCTEFDCTSLIFSTTKREHLILAEYILNCFKNLLESKIKELYELNTDSIDDHIRPYCMLLSEHCKKNADNKHAADKNNCGCCEPVSNCNNSNEEKENEIKMNDGCLFENKMALRLTKDSQIYKHLRWIEKNEMNVEDVVANYFVEKFGGSTEGLNKFYDFLVKDAGERNG